MVQSGDTLVLSLAELLGGKQVDTGVIDRVLAELCSAFDFDGGLIYELDQYNHLHLKERCLRKELPLRGSRSTRSTLLTAAIWLRKPLSGWRVDKRTVRLRMLCWSCLRRSRW
ncbi:MAG: hypothetical protein ACLRXQ_04075 [Phascolarctobacterium faecium]